MYTAHGKHPFVYARKGLCERERCVDLQMSRPVSPACVITSRFISNWMKIDHEQITYNVGCRVGLQIIFLYM